MVHGTRPSKDRALPDHRTARLRAPGQIVALSCTVIMSLAVFDRLVFDELVSPEYSELILASNERTLFGPIYLIAFFLDLFAISWLLVEGVQSPNPVVRNVALLTRRFFSWRFFVFLGQHSLQVFAFHMVVIYAVVGYYADRQVGLIEGGLVLAAIVVSLLIPATIRAVSVKRQKRKLINIARTT